MNKLIPFLFSILIIHLVTLELKATNYYVANNGSDTENGTSPERAWKTISHVNSQNFSSGDSILFKCGDRWMELLDISSSGDKENYIVFSSYGNGEKPKLYGSKKVLSFSTHPNLANVYVINDTMAFNPYEADNREYVASIFYIENDSVSWGDGVDLYETSIQQLDTLFEWSWQNDSLYFYYSGNIDDIQAIECPQLPRGINVGGEYIVIDGLDLRYFGSRCIGHAFYPEVTKNGLIIRNCETAYTGAKDHHGFGISLVHSNSIIEKNKIHSNGRRNLSVYIQNYASNAIIRDVVIQNNEIWDGYHASIDMAIHGSTAQMKNIVIRNNKIWEWANYAKEDDNNFVNLINNGELENYDSIFIYNNEMRNTNGNSFYVDQVNHLFIVHNSISGYANLKGAFFYFPDLGGEQGTTFSVNNIFLNYKSSMSFINGSGDGSNKYELLNHNLYFSVANPYLLEDFPAGGDRIRYEDYLDFQTLGFGINSIFDTLPHFIDSTSNLTLKNSSPAIGRGTPISFVTTDIQGKIRNPSTPDIGAYEHISSTVNIESLNQAYSNLSIYPNPAKQCIFISGIENKSTYEIYDSKGCVVQSGIYYIGNSININNLIKGTYIVRFNNITSAKFMK